MRVLNARQRKGRIKTQEKKTRDESRVDQEFAIQYGGPSDRHEQRLGKRKRGGRLFASHEGARSAIRGTRARPPALSHCAPIHHPRPCVSQHHRHCEIVRQGSRSSLRYCVVGVAPRPCVLSSSAAVEVVSKPAAVRATVMAMIQGLERPSPIETVYPHHLRPRPPHPRHHLYYLHPHLHRYPYLRLHPVAET